MSKKLIYLIILFLSLWGLQCKRHNTATSQTESYKSLYIDEFKLTYFKQMLIKGYNSSEAVQKIIEGDHSGYTEPVLLMADLKLIDSLTTLDNEKMIIDSAEGNGEFQRAEGSQGKRPLGYILDKVRSNWLDSLAEQRFKLSGLP
jgi:hypothetical protein